MGKLFRPDADASSRGGCGEAWGGAWVVRGLSGSDQAIFSSQLLPALPELPLTHSRTSAGGTSSQATRVAWGKKLCGQAGHCPPPWVVEIQGGGPQYPGLQTNPLRCQLLGLPPWILYLPNTPSSVLTPFPPLYSLCPAAPHPPWMLFFLQQPFLPAPLSNAPRGVLQ